MSGTNDGRPMPSPEDKIPESTASQTVTMDVAMEMLNRKTYAGAEKFTLAMERFSVLSTEMITLLMGLSQEIHDSAEELNGVRAAVQQKRKELEELREAELAARALKQQTDALIKQKDELEKLILEQRSAWEAEKDQRTREVEEQRNNWNAEQFKARQELDQELRMIRQRHQEAQEEAERDLAERDMLLKKKELEWSELIQELDQFLAKLTGRFHPHPVAHILAKEESAEIPAASATGIPLSGYFRDENEWAQGDIEPDLNREDPLIWDNIWGDKDYPLEDRHFLLGQSSIENSRSAYAIFRDAHTTQNGKLENSESSAKKDNAPLKFAPKNSNHA